MRLEGNGLAYRHGRGPWLFRGASLSVGEGELVGLSGPSGCGKTTLARLLAGFERPLEGRVTIGGRPIPDRGYCPVQLVLQHPEQAVNPRWRIKRTLTEGWRPGPDMLDALGIQPGWLERWPSELSGGELQRICIARAMGPDTRFLIADEMTTMLDAITQAQIWNAVLDIAGKRGLGVLVVSHDAGLLSRVCDRVVRWEELAAPSSSPQAQGGINRASLETERP